MVNVGLLRAVACRLRDDPDCYDQTTMEGKARSMPNLNGTSDACDIIGQILMSVGCKRLYGATGYEAPIWCHATNRRVSDPIAHAIGSLELPDDVTRDFYKTDWAPPKRYGAGPIAVANYFDALAGDAEFWVLLDD